jgi:hypothetical protein
VLHPSLLAARPSAPSHPPAPRAVAPPSLFTPTLTPMMTTPAIPPELAQAAGQGEGEGEEAQLELEYAQYPGQEVYAEYQQHPGAVEGHEGQAHDAVAYEQWYQYQQQYHLQGGAGAGMGAGDFQPMIADEGDDDDMGAGQVGG